MDVIRQKIARDNDHHHQSVYEMAIIIIMIWFESIVFDLELIECFSPKLKIRKLVPKKWWWWSVEKPQSLPPQQWLWSSSSASLSTSNNKNHDNECQKAFNWWGVFRFSYVHLFNPLMNFHPMKSTRVNCHWQMKEEKNPTAFPITITWNLWSRQRSANKIWKW